MPSERLPVLVANDEARVVMFLESTMAAGSAGGWHGAIIATRQALR
jgi:hypothetical protein